MRSTLDTRRFRTKSGSFVLRKFARSYSRSRIALYPMESDAYRRFAQADGVTTLVLALRSKRA